MKTNQAKAIAGINYNLATREHYVRAERDCVKLIIAARKANNDARAAELSEAKSFFQKRIRTRNTCAVCGVTIARGATHCRIHSRGQKKIAAPADWQPSQKPRCTGNNNARVSAFPHGGRLAMLGFYSAPVRKVIAKHLAEVGIDNLQTYFERVAMPVIYGCEIQGSELKMKKINPRHWLSIFELGVAIAKLHNNSKSIESWLVKQPYPIGKKLNFVSFKARPWAEVIAGIEQRGGPSFSENQLKQAAKKMMLLTNRKVAANWRGAMGEHQQQNPNSSGCLVVS